MTALPISTALILGFAAAAATLSGGAVALRLKSALPIMFSFSSGVVIGVALFDLLPEAARLSPLSNAVVAVGASAVGGFILYLGLDRLGAKLVGRQARHRGHLAPATLTAHSLMDGLAIGLAFEVSSAAGVLVAIAVLGHDFLDGANTVSLALAGGASRPAARRWLAADALAPAIGIIATRFITVPPLALSTLLAIFAGGFLYIGAGELLPRGRDGGFTPVKVMAMAIGLAAIYLLLRITTA